jgi:hypothetical protein
VELPVVLVDIGDKGYYANLTDGKATIKVAGLTKDTYTAIVTYLGDDNYKNSTTTTTFVVSEGIKINVDGTGNSTNITVVVPGNETAGNVTVIIDNTTTYVTNVTNGSATVDLGNLTPGEHNVTVIYVDANGTASEVNATITVPKWDSEITIVPVNIREGDTETIEITVGPTGVTGRVLVDIAGKGYYVNLTDGKATLEVIGLKEGTYTAFATYMGDDNYKNATTNASFKVSAPIKIEVGGSGNDSVINITVPDNGTGNVTVIIDNKTYTVVNVTNGTAIVNLTNVTPGEHNITVIYTDGNGTTSVVNDTITVKFSDAPLNVTVSDIKVGETAKITVEVPSGATGEITIEINGISYTQTISGGKATFDVTDLAFGVKTVAVEYAGDTYYAGNSTTANFTVSKNPAPISVTVEGADAGGKATVTVNDLPGDATGYVIVNVNGTEYGINITKGENSVKVPVIKAGNYIVNVTYLGDEKYLSNSTSGSFKANRTQANVTITVENATVGGDVIVKVIVPQDAEGNITVQVDNITKVVNATGGENVIAIPGLGEGAHPINVTYSGDDKYESKEYNGTVYVTSSIIGEAKMTRGWNSEFDYEAEFSEPTVRSLQTPKSNSS